MGDCGKKRSVCLCLLALFFLGCSSNNTTQPQNDPLVGRQPPLPKDNGSATARGPEQGLPPVPAPSAGTSQAALAGGQNPTLDSGLRIGADAEKDAATWRGSGAGLGVPVPLADGAAARIQPITPVSISGSPESAEQYLRSLQMHGMKGFRLEQLPATGQWHCVCSIPNRENQNAKRTYDATADDAVAALRAVLDKIEHPAQ
jgi:hypothetical protein